MNAPFNPEALPPTSAPPSLDPCLAPVALDDKYTLPQGRVLMNGAQALVRLMLDQKARDEAEGLNTAGFVSGYRGSPLGGVDQAFWAAKLHLQKAQVRFAPGLNEDLAATAVWGTQQVNLYPDATVEGVFGLWYGKGPGVDRSLDVFKHANAAGTSPRGGVLLVAGDDHGAKSSSLPHQSDHVLKAATIPILFPSSIQEILDFGLLGYAMSRYAGVWVGLKLVADVVECTATVEVGAGHQTIVLPQHFALPPGGLNIRWPDTPLDQEARLLDYKLYAALAFCRANRINHTVIDSPHAHFGIVATGKAFQDTLQALRDLGLTPDRCQALGVRVYKVGMVWPLDAVGIREFARGLREILVIEEKRQWVEYQIKEELYAWREDVRPKVYGKFDERLAEDGMAGGEWAIPQGEWLLPCHDQLDPTLVARAIAKRLLQHPMPVDVRMAIGQRLQAISAREQHQPIALGQTERKPYFCSGCPHSTSTVVPEGSRAMAGIGCHYMAVWMNRSTETCTQMGGEGVPWIGQAPFVRTPHIFANLGDGTYFHSGVLAIRASVAAGVNITYKLLFNDAVAMTGGQPLDGHLTVPMLTRQLAAEGVARIVVVSETPENWLTSNPKDPMAAGVPVLPRSALDAVQRELREVPGTTVLVFEQTCASEKRRRRKRRNPSTGQPLYPNPQRRVLINPRVCEGCGDCSKVSNCLSIEPLATPWGVKRTINQSTCNKDTRCLEGLCPSLITIESDDLLPPILPQEALKALVSNLPLPNVGEHGAALQTPYKILINGVGGTGVVTLGAWLAMAAHLQGYSALTLDMAGLAQKGGAVYSHVHLAPQPQDLAAARIPVGEVDLMVGGDVVVSAMPKTLELLRPGACAVINTDAPPTADFIHDRNQTVPNQALRHSIAGLLAAEHLAELPAQQLALHLLGDAVYANPMLLGQAWQRGWLPLRRDALRRAIELNGVQVANNLLAFELGRAYAVTPQAVWALLNGHQGHSENSEKSESADVLLQRLHQDLCAYQDQAYANAFLARVQPLHKVFQEHGQEALWMQLCRSYHRVLAFKDEFEVARLHADRTWLNTTHAQFGPKARMVFYFAPSWLGRGGANASPNHGRQVKRRFGAWVLPLLRLLAGFKGLRGTWLDPFKHTEERSNQNELRQLFESLLDLVHNKPNMLQYSKEIEQVLVMMDEIKGFGHVRNASFARVFEPLCQAIKRFNLAP